MVYWGTENMASEAEAGGSAVGLGSTANLPQLVKLCRLHPPAVPLILSLDNDEEGEKAAARLEEQLWELNVKTIRANISGDHKDPNEALMADRERFCADVLEAARRAGDAGEEQRQQELERLPAFAAARPRDGAAGQKLSEICGRKTLGGPWLHRPHRCAQAG